QENQTKLIYLPKTERPISRDQERNTGKEECVLVNVFSSKKTKQQSVSNIFHKQKNQTTKLIYQPKTESPISRDQVRNIRKEECIPIPNEEAKKKYQKRRKGISNVFHKQENQTKLIYPLKTKNLILRDQERNTRKKECKKKYQERRKNISNIFHKQENQTKLIYLLKLKVQFHEAKKARKKGINKPKIKATCFQQSDQI
ncbi:24952_t:CDS:2, partial [Cetraspora pellucida]